MDLKKLKEPFPAEDIEWRIGRCGVYKKDGKDTIWAKALAYITARAIHDRLDDVCGPSNWQLRYKEHLGETICEIGIKINNEWVWKAGGADKTDFEAFKGGLSSAEKRAGVPWGIGRYLYNLDETFVECKMQKQSGWNYQNASKKKDGSIKVPAFYWKIPILPDWALPKKNNAGDREAPTGTVNVNAPSKNENKKDVDSLLKIKDHLEKIYNKTLTKDSEEWKIFRNFVIQQFGSFRQAMEIEADNIIKNVKNLEDLNKFYEDSPF